MTLQETQKWDKKWNIQTIFEFNYSTVSCLKFAGRWEGKIKQEMHDSGEEVVYAFIYITGFEAGTRH